MTADNPERRANYFLGWMPLRASSNQSSVVQNFVVWTTTCILHSSVTDVLDTNTGAPKVKKEAEGVNCNERESSLGILQSQEDHTKNVLY